MFRNIYFKNNEDGSFTTVTGLDAFDTVEEAFKSAELSKPNGWEYVGPTNNEKVLCFNEAVMVKKESSPNPGEYSEFERLFESVHKTLKAAGIPHFCLADLGEEYTSFYTVTGEQLFNLMANFSSDNHEMGQTILSGIEAGESDPEGDQQG